MEKKQPSRVKCCVWFEFHASHWGHSFWTVVHLKVTANPLNTNPNVVSPCSHICRWCHSSLWRVNKTRAKQVDMARSMEGWLSNDGTSRFIKLNILFVHDNWACEQSEAMDGEKMALCRAQAGTGFMQEWMMAKHNVNLRISWSDIHAALFLESTEALLIEAPRGLAN